MSNFAGNTLPETVPTNSGNLNGAFVQVLVEVVEDLSIGAGALRLYLVLLGTSKGFASCWPGQRELAEKLGVSERMVRVYLKELEQAGLIETEHRGRPGLEQTNIYRLLKRVSKKGQHHQQVRDKEESQEEEHKQQDKYSASSGGTIVPVGAESTFRHVRKNTSATIHESTIHESEDLNTPKAESVTREQLQLPVTVCEVSAFVREERREDQNYSNEQEASIKVIEQSLKLFGVSVARARKVALVLLENGRSAQYVEEWQRWIRSQDHIQNPAAYLLSRIQEDTEVPKARESRCGSRSERKQWQGFTGGKYQGFKVISNNQLLTNCSSANEAGKRETELESQPVVARAVEQRENDSYGVKQQTDPSPCEVKPEIQTAVSSEMRVDFRLKELLAQRDARIKRVKRLEVVGDTLAVEFWAKHEAEMGPGESWLADTRWFYPEVRQVELV